MKKLILTLFTLLPLITYAQTYDWVKQYGNTESVEEVTDMCRDNAGNFYLTGTFTGTVNFGSIELVSAGSTDIFVLKLDADGNVINAVRGGGAGTDFSTCIIADGSGNSYICGEFANNSDFGSILLSSNGPDDIFVCKMDASLNIDWVKKGGSTTTYDDRDKAEKIIFSESSNSVILLTMSYKTVIFGDYTNTTSQYEDYIVEYNSVDGTEISIHVSQAERGTIESTDFKKVADDTYIHSSQDYQYSKIYVSKINKDGVVLQSKFSDFLTDSWHHTEESINMTKVNVTHYPYIYITGTFYKRFSWDNLSLFNNGSPDTYDIFTAKINMEEDSVYWLKRIGGTQDDRPYAIESDGEKNVYITGYFENTADFGSGVQLSTPGRAAFVCKYDSLGNLQWAKNTGSGSGDEGRAISVDAATGTAHIAGRFYAETQFDDTTLTSAGSSDIFLAKLVCSPAKPSEITGDTLLCIGNQDYSVINSPSLNYGWQISGGGTLSQNANEVSVNWTSPGTHILTCSPANTCGAGVSRSIQIRVKELPQDLSLSGESLACTGTEAYNVIEEAEVGYDWQINGGGQIFGIGSTAVVNWTIPGAYTMTVTPSNMCGTGNPLSQNIEVATLPAQPDPVTGNSEVCTGTQSYSVPGSSVSDFNWSLSSGGVLSFTEELAGVNWESAGMHTLTVTPVNRCGSGIPRSIVVEVSDVPAQPSTINGNQSVCVGTTQYGVQQVSGENYAWTLSGGGMLTQNAASAEVYWTTPGTYTLSATPNNHCGTGTSKNIQITVKDIPLQPAAIIGIETVCLGDQIYQTPEIQGVNYNWSLSGGGSLTPNNNIAQIDWDTPGNHTITVVPYNICGTGISKSLPVTVNSTTSLISGITGNNQVCLSAENYTAQYVGSLTYNWLLATGGTISATAENASVNWNQTGFHTLILETSDGCAQSLVVEVNDIPSQPSVISGENPVCIGESGYFVNHETNTTYNWTVSGGANLTESVNTVSANWNLQGIHTLTVTPSNLCGNGAARTFSIEVKDVPAQPSAISAQDTACLESTAYAIIPVAGTDYDWQIENAGGVLIPANENADIIWLYPHENTVSVSLSNLCGTSPMQNKIITVSDIPVMPDISGNLEVCLGEAIYASEIENGHTLLWNLGSGGSLSILNDSAKINWTTPGNHIVSLTKSNRCGASQTKSIIVNVKDIPAQPGNITGETAVCFGISNYEIPAAAETNYLWTINGGGTISELENSANINWNQAGSFEIAATPYNICGSGTPRNLTVNVSTIPLQTAEIQGNDTVCLSAEAYLVTPESGTDYLWTLTGGGGTAAFQNTVNVNWSETGLYTLSVTPSNFCGAGISRSKTVMVNDIPDIPAFAEFNAQTCIGTENYAVNQQSGASYS